MFEIALKLLIIIIFLSMEEIPYIIKILAVTILGVIVIVDWYTADNNE